MRSLLVFALSLMLCSCGYHFAEEGRLPGKVSRIYIPAVVNHSGEAYVETTLVSFISREFARYRGFSEVGNADLADAELDVTVNSLQLQAVSYDSNDDVAELNASLTIAARLTSPADQGILWSRQLSWQTTYVASDDKMVQEEGKQKAISELCQRLAEELLFQLQKHDR